MYLSVDIGGTNTRIAISSDGKTIDKKVKYPTPQNYDDALDLLVDSIESIAQGDVPKTIVVAIPGVIDKVKGKIQKAPNLSHWNHHSIGPELEHRLKCNVILENDACLGAMAEAHYKPHRKYKILSYVTLSTGIGGARTVNGLIDYHASSFEPGHQILDPNGRFWPNCGQHGCFESLGSGRAFELTYGIKPENCEDYKIWEEHARVVSQGLVNIITIWSPEILVLGGSLVNAGHKFLDPLIHLTSSDIKIFPSPKIVISKLGDNNVLLGGFQLLNHRQKFSH